MTRLSYEYMSKNGEIKIFSSYQRLMEEVSVNGGQWKPVYTPIDEPYEYKGKRKRPKI